MSSNLTYDKRKNKECAILSFRNSHMADSLAKYGIIPQKTYKTKHLPEIPQELLRHFLRGLLDGDGSIYKESKSQKYRIDYCSYHQSICEEFRSLCNNFLTKKNTVKISNYGTAYHVRFNDQKSVKQLATVLYKDSNVSLARKYSLAREIFEDNSEDDIVYSDH
jgi:intein/homing endonuclease